MWRVFSDHGLLSDRKKRPFPGDTFEIVLAHVSEFDTGADHEILNRV